MTGIMYSFLKQHNITVFLFACWAWDTFILSDNSSYTNTFVIIEVLRDFSTNDYLVCFPRDDDISIFLSSIPLGFIYKHTAGPTTHNTASGSFSFHYGATALSNFLNGLLCYTIMKNASFFTAFLDKNPKLVRNYTVVPLQHSARKQAKHNYNKSIW